MSLPNMRCAFRVTPPFLAFLLMSVVLSASESDGASGAALPQNADGQSTAVPQDNGTQRQMAQPATSSVDENHLTANATPLLLGPGDDLEITVYGAPDLSGRARINETGNITMPLIGYVRLAGLSTSEAEAAIEAQLRQNKIVNDPQVSIYAKDFTSSGISVAGEVGKPGFYSALGPHRLFDVLQLAGGTTERASSTVTISHRGQTDSRSLRIPPKWRPIISNSDLVTPLLYPGQVSFTFSERSRGRADTCSMRVAESPSSKSWRPLEGPLILLRMARPQFSTALQRDFRNKNSI